MSTTPAQPSPPPQSRFHGIRTRYWIALLLLSVAWIAVILHAMPVGYRSSWGILRRDLLAIHLFDMPALSTEAFRNAFRIGLVGSYAAYVGMLTSARRMRDLPIRKSLILVAAAGVVLAIFFPTCLSTDVYSYIAYARMDAVYHLNPYFHYPHELAGLHDITVPYLSLIGVGSRHAEFKWDIPSVYGPLWTLLSSGLIAVERGSGLWIQTVTMKLIEVIALCLTAYAGWRMALRLCPDYAPVVFLAIGFNPLILTECVGSGHNDLLMMAFLMWGASLMLDRKPGWGALALGASLAIKFITLPAIPWILWESRRQLKRIPVAVVVLLALCAPLVVTFAPYWHGSATLSAVVRRGSGKSVADVGRSTPAQAQAASVQSLRSMVSSRMPLMALFFWLTLGIVVRSLMERRRDSSAERPDGGGGLWMPAWTILSAMLVYNLMGMLFPWYFVWVWPTASSRWNKLHVNLSAMVGTAAFAFSWLYTIVNGFVVTNFLINLAIGAALVILALNYLFIKKKN